MGKNYVPKPGGWKWVQALTGNLQRNREALAALRALEQVASNDATRVRILQAQVALTQNQVDLEKLLAWSRGGEDDIGVVGTDDA